jgi:hypothetical protein
MMERDCSRYGMDTSMSSDQCCGQLGSGLEEDQTVQGSVSAQRTEERHCRVRCSAYLEQGEVEESIKTVVLQVLPLIQTTITVCCRGG